MFLPPEGEREAIHDFKIIGSTLLEFTDFIQKTQLRTSVLRIANPTKDMGRVKSKNKLRAHALTSAVIDDSSNIFGSARNYLIFIFDDIWLRILGDQK